MKKAVDFIRKIPTFVVKFSFVRLRCHPFVKVLTALISSKDGNLCLLSVGEVVYIAQILKYCFYQGVTFADSQFFYL